MKINFKISIFMAFFYCLILLASSINPLENDDNSGEDESNSQTPKTERVSSIEDQLNRILVELRKPRKVDVEFSKINEALNGLKSTVDEIKLQVNKAAVVHDQLSDGIHNLTKQNDALQIGINQVLSRNLNETLKKPAIIIPFIDFHKCYKSMNIVEEKPTFTWVLTDMKKKMEWMRSEMERVPRRTYHHPPPRDYKYVEMKSLALASDIFPLKGYYSMKAQAGLTFGGDGILYFNLTFKDSDKSSSGGDVVDLKLLPTVIVVFKNQSELGRDNDVRIRERILPLNKTLKYDAASYETILLNSTYEASDVALIDIYVETPQQAEQSCSEDGSIAWLVRDVRKARELERTENVDFHASPYFYSSPQGYILVVGIRLNYLSKGKNKTELFAFTFATKGPYDAGIILFSSYNITYTFLHPTEPAKNLVKRIEYNRRTQSAPDPLTVSDEELETELAYDTLYYHVKIEIV